MKTHEKIIFAGLAVLVTSLTIPPFLFPNHKEMEEVIGFGIMLAATLLFLGSFE